MRPITAVVFDHEDCQVVRAAARFIDLAFPLATTPLVSPEDGVADDHPLRRAVIGIANPFDPLTYGRLLKAWQALDAIRARMAEEGDLDWWLTEARSRPETEPSEQEHRMAEALVAERRGQQPRVEAALTLVERALAQVSADDEPRRLAQIDEAGFDEDAEAERRWLRRLDATADWVLAHGREPRLARDSRGAIRTADPAVEPDEDAAAQFLAHQRDAARGRRFTGWSPARRRLLNEYVPGWERPGAAAAHDLR